MKLLIMDHTGHTTLDTKDISIEEMKARFDELVRPLKDGGKGYVASVGRLDNMERVKEFPTSLKEGEEILMTGPIVGG